MAISLASRLAPDPAKVPVWLRVLSLGAGVHSTTLALMAAQGEVGPMLDCAVFADNGCEPRAVYRHLAWLMAPVVFSFSVHAASSGNIRDDLLAGSQGQRRAFRQWPFTYLTGRIKTHAIHPRTMARADHPQGGDEVVVHPTRLSIVGDQACKITPVDRKTEIDEVISCPVKTLRKLAAAPDPPQGIDDDPKC